MDQVVMPPLGILYLGTAIVSSGRDDLYIVDLASNYGTPEPIVSPPPDIVGITATTPQFGDVLNALPRIRESFPGVPIAIGGSHATSDPNSCTDFDYIVIGEGERAIVDWRNWSGKFIQYPVVEDIDTLPHPDRTLIDINRYHYTIDGVAATTAMTSRGCPYSCRFCCKTWGSKVRLHSPEYILEEVRYLKGIGYDAVMFFDDIFAVSKSRVKAITDLLAGEDIIYRCFVGSDRVDREILTMLRNSGCVEIGFGAESGSQSILDIVGKQNTVENNTRLVQLAKDIGIRSKAFLMVGLPGETNGTCQETYDWIMEAAPDSWDISIYQPYKGAHITDHPDEYDIEIDDVAYSDMFYKGKRGEYTCCVKTSGLMPSEIVQWREKISTELGGARYNHPEEV